MPDSKHGRHDFDKKGLNLLGVYYENENLDGILDNPDVY